MRHLLLCICFITSVALEAQETSVSPYSAFGLGDSKFYVDPTTLSMGETPTAYLSPTANEFNFYNPASNRNLEYASFNVSLNTDLANLKQGDVSENASNTYLSRISLAIPIDEKTKVGASFQPYSGVGYNLALESELENGNTQTNAFEGEGSVNQLQLAVSRNVGKKITLGASLNYNFGRIKRSQLIEVEGNQLLTEYSSTSDVNGFSFLLGAFYHQPLKDEKYYSLGASFSAGSDLKADKASLIQTFQYLDGTQDPFNIDTVAFETGSRKVNFPTTLSFGAEYGSLEDWRIGAQFKYEINKDFSLLDDLNVSPTYQLNDAWRVSVGGFWVPNRNSYDSYFERVSYRGGLFFEDTAPQINNENVLMYGLTLGAGLPVGKKSESPSYFNIGMEIGQRNPSSAGYVRENFANFSLGITLTDVWFRRRKID